MAVQISMPNHDGARQWDCPRGICSTFTPLSCLPPTLNKIQVYHKNNAVSDLQPGSCLMAGLARRELFCFAIIAVVSTVMTEPLISSQHTIHQTAGKENNGNDDKEVRKRSRTDHPAADCDRLDPPLSPALFFPPKNHTF